MLKPEKMNLQKLIIRILLIGIVLPLTVVGQNNIPGLDYLGRGYNIFGKYADPDDCKAQLFDFSTQKTTQTGGTTYYLPDGIEFVNASKKSVKTITGNSSREYIKELGVSAGLEYDGFLFQGSVEGSFFNSQFGYSSTAFTTITDANTKWRLWFDIMTDADVVGIQKKLKPKVRERLNSASVAPKQIFDIYGSHYLADVYIGATAYYNAITTITEKMDVTKIGVSVKASYGSFSGSASTNSNRESKEITENTQTEFKVVGGNAEFLQNLSNTDMYMKWAEGIKESSVLCDFSENSLRPIWELCENKERAKELENYFYKEYLSSFPLPPVASVKLNPMVVVNKVMNGMKDKPVFQGSFTGKGAQEYIYFSTNGLELVYGDKFQNKKTIARYGTTLGGWLFEHNNTVVGAGDFNGDGISDLLLQSPWGIGLLHLGSDLFLKDYFMKPYGTALGGWQINDGDQLVVGMFRKDGNKSSIAVKSGWGLGKLGYTSQQNGLVATYMEQCKKVYGGWQLNADDRIFYAGDIDNNGFDDLLIQSGWGLGVLSGTNNGYSGMWAMPNKTMIGGWQLNVGDIPMGVGDVNGDNKEDILIQSAWGMALLTFDHGLAAFWVKPYKTVLGSWEMNTGDKIIGAIDFTEDKKTDILISSPWGKGVLQYAEENVRHFWMRQE